MSPCSEIYVSRPEVSVVDVRLPWWSSLKMMSAQVLIFTGGTHLSFFCKNAICLDIKSTITPEL